MQVACSLVYHTRAEQTVVFVLFDVVRHEAGKARAEKDRRIKIYRHVDQIIEQRDRIVGVRVEPFFACHCFFDCLVNRVEIFTVWALVYQFGNVVFHEKCARVVFLHVHAVAEAHDFVFAREFAHDVALCSRWAAGLVDFEKHLHRRFICTAVQRALERGHRSSA